ncbi:hypothetical protein HpCK67_04030 [Helicobacter pylori]
MITSFEVDEKVLRELETIAPLSNTITEMADYSISNLEPNSTTNLLKKQDLSALEQANAEKLAKLESERSRIWIKEVVSKKSAEKAENQFTLK